MPNTLEENVNRVKAAKTAIGNAITAKGGTVGANDGLEDFAADIATIPSGGGGGSQPIKDVNFYDYDGTIVNSYTAAEFAELTAFPDNPSHDGLTAQGWNWSLSDAKTYVASYGKLEIGQMYASNTTNGKTLLHIRLGEGRLKPYLGLTGNSSGTAISIDWGDGSATESVTLDTLTVYTSHEYASDGEYIISISVTSGSVSLNGTSNSTNLFRKSSSANDGLYANILRKAEIGTGVTSIGNSAFSSCYSLTSITIPSSVTSIGNSAFNGCYSLKTIIIPSGVTSIGSSAFSACSSLTSIAIPSSLTSIGSSAFQNCYSLTSVIIPSGISVIGTNAFNKAKGLGFIKFSSSTPPAVLAANTWGSVQTDCIIYVPQGSLSDYTSANNYPSSSIYTYVEY